MNVYIYQYVSIFWDRVRDQEFENSYLVPGV